jgi:glycerol uptake facilitator protein
VAAGIASGDFTNVPGYILAQLTGAIVGACLVWIHYLPHWRETPEADLKFACFATSPAIRSAFANLMSEIIGTFVLVLVADAIGSKLVAPGGLAPGVGPWLVGGVVWAIGLGLGGTTGYAINPARDLGPRIAHAFLPIPAKGSSDWSYAPIPIVGPLIGASLAALLARAAHI